LYTDCVAIHCGHTDPLLLEITVQELGRRVEKVEITQGAVVELQQTILNRLDRLEQLMQGQLAPQSYVPQQQPHPHITLHIITQHNRYG